MNLPAAPKAGSALCSDKPWGIKAEFDEANPTSLFKLRRVRPAIFSRDEAFSEGRSSLQQAPGYSGEGEEKYTKRVKTTSPTLSYSTRLSILADTICRRYV